MVNLVYVCFENSNGAYLYKAPLKVKLEKGQVVYAQVRKQVTPTHVTCLTDSFEVPADTANVICRECCGVSMASFLANIIGYAVPAYSMVSFDED